MSSLVLKLILFFTFFSVALGESDAQPPIEIIQDGVKGTGIMTGYWDCCKPSCGWKGNIHVKTKKAPVTTCAIDGVTKIDTEEQSGCAKGGKSFMCSNQVPWIVNKTLAYGFSAVSLKGGTDYGLCCSCFMLTFETNNKMIVQYTNTGGDLLVNQFDLAMPGAGVGYNTLGCKVQWNAPDNGWGKRYGGVATEAECAELPKQLQEACRFRFHFKMSYHMSFEQVKCPAELMKRSGCEI